MIPLMKNAFLEEKDTRKELSKFILKNDRLSMGNYCSLFENKFAEYQQCKYAILFNSGGSANLAIIQTLRNLEYLKDGDKVGFSALTWSTNVMPIIQLGLIPVPVDIEKTTLNVMSNNIIESLKKNELKAFFATNVLGLSGDLNQIKKICNRKNIIFVEDNCEALGSSLPSGNCGNFGLMSSFSFYVAHHMSTIEGGMVCTNDEDMMNMLKMVRANGWDRNLDSGKQQNLRKKYNINKELTAKYTFYDLGYNLRPTEITGFIGQNQLKFLDEANIKRKENYEILALKTKENDDMFVIDYSHMLNFAPFAFPILCKSVKSKKIYVSKFLDAGIEIRPMIAGNIQIQPFYKKYISELSDLPNTEFVHNNGFYCGNYPELTRTELGIISNCMISNSGEL